MKREDGKMGFGEIFKGYGDALDIISEKQKELSVWKKDTTEIIKPLREVDVVELNNVVGDMKNILQEMKNKYSKLSHNYDTLEHRCNILSDMCDTLKIENKQILKQYLGVSENYCKVREENENLKNDLIHLQELTDVISLTCSKECADLKNMAKKKVMVMLGGNTTDERYKLFYKKYIMNLYSYMKKELGVSSIDKIPTVKLAKAQDLVGKWQPTLSFKKKLITDLVKETTPTKNGAFKTKVETVVQFNSLMEKYNGEPEKYI